MIRRRVVFQILAVSFFLLIMGIIAISHPARFLHARIVEQEPSRQDSSASTQQAEKPGKLLFEVWFINPATGIAHLSLSTEHLGLMTHGWYQSDTVRQMVSDSCVGAFVRAIHSSNFCSKKSKEASGLANFTSILFSFKKVQCTVTLSDKEWSKTKQGRRILRALEAIRREICGGKCSWF